MSSGLGCEADSQSPCRAARARWPGYPASGLHDGSAVSITEIRIQSLGEFVDRVTPSAADPRTGRRRDTGVYRGSSRADAPLLTSLDRLGGTSPPHQKAGLEEHILRNFIRYSRPYIGHQPSNDWENLVVAQHYGVPTRLLDWTYSPLVAAFFATRLSSTLNTRPAESEVEPSVIGPAPGADEGTDGAADLERAVWRLDWQLVHRAFDFPALALFSADLDALFGMEGQFTPWRMFARPRKDPPFALLMEPPSVNQRLVAQAAVFTVCSDKWISFDSFLVEHGLGSALTKFVIEDGAVALVRDQLDLVGVDERRLFPDLDGVAATLRRYYT